MAFAFIDGVDGACFEEPSCGCTSGPANIACSTNIPGGQPYCYVPAGCPGSKGGTFLDPNTYQYCTAIPCTEAPVYNACRGTLGGGRCDGDTQRVCSGSICSCCLSGNNGLPMVCASNDFGMFCTCVIPQVCVNPTSRPTFAPPTTLPPTFDFFTFPPTFPQVFVPGPSPTPPPTSRATASSTDNSLETSLVIGGGVIALLAGVAGVATWYVRKSKPTNAIAAKVEATTV